MKHLLLSFAICLSLTFSSLAVACYRPEPTAADIAAHLHESFTLYKTLSEHDKELVKQYCLFDIEMFKSTGDVFNSVYEKACALEDTQKIFQEYHADVQRMQSLVAQKEKALKNQCECENIEFCVMQIRATAMLAIQEMQMAVFHAMRVLMNGDARKPVPVITLEMVEYIKATRPAAQKAVEAVVQHYQDVLDQLA